VAAYPGAESVFFTKTRDAVLEDFDSMEKGGSLAMRYTRRTVADLRPPLFLYIEE
jgi:hypothetical protein